MDLFLVFFPPLLFTLFERKKINVIKYILLGQLPFIFWEIFSLLYYGFLIPNTAYAKLAHGVSRFIIIKQGITYFYNSIINDPLTIFVIILGILLPLISCKKDKKLIVLSTSILLYLFYTLWIGGDFMSGRFFTVPLVISCIVLLHISPIFSHEQILSLICVILVLGLFLPFNTLSLDVKEYSFNINGVDDERIYFFPGMSLITRYRNHMQPEFEWKDQGIEYRNSGIKVTHARAIGLFGFYCGPNVHIIDGHGLADPLLSHLKVNTTSQFTSGHISKDPPKGYIESLNSGINLISDPKIHKYYDKVLIITRGEIFSWDRIKTIFRMNLGKYDYLL
jgi:arabinofuranosyltransferase